MISLNRRVRYVDESDEPKNQLHFLRRGANILNDYVMEQLKFNWCT